MKASVTQLCLTLQSYGQKPARLLCTWDSPGKNTGVSCHFLLQGTFLTQGSNPGLPHCRQFSWPSEPQGKEVWVKNFPVFIPLSNLGPIWDVGLMEDCVESQKKCLVELRRQYGGAKGAYFLKLCHLEWDFFVLPLTPSQELGRSEAAYIGEC